ncbi:MAG: chitobiase/beta-hexosaminidase C-terminal domain-containing protein, partial [Thermoguttaceae bacterium]
MHFKKIPVLTKKMKFSLFCPEARHRRTCDLKRLSFEPLEPRLALSSNPIITEFMASNTHTLADGNGQYPDWIEIHNPNTTSFDISGWYLTDNPNKLTKWQFPTGTILSAGEYRVIFCDDGESTYPAGEIHTTFKLDKDGEYIGLVKSDGTTIVSEYGPNGSNFPVQTEDVSYGIYDPSVKLSNTFDSDLNGFTYQDSVLTNNASEARVDGVWSSTGGNIGTGGLQITGTMSTTGRYVNGGFYKSVSIAAADSYNFSVAYRMVLTDGSNNFHTNEYGEAYLVVKNASGNILYGSDGTQYLIHLAGNGTGSCDSGWLQSNFNLNLSAGNYTVILALKNSPLTSPISDNNTVVLDFDNLAITENTASTTSIQYFTSPTPGAANSLGVLGRVEDQVEFSQDHGLFTSPFYVTLACDTPGATIRYTTDGSEPQFNTGTLYTGPIHITGTTVLSASAFKTNYEQSEVATASYFFLSDVITQSANGVAPAGWPAAGNSVYGTYQGAYRYFDYGMDPNIISTYGSSAVISALESVPTVSLVTDLNNLFGASTGIITNSNQSGDAWKKDASIEYINPDGTAGFTSNSSISLRGSACTDDNSLTKYSFHVAFDSTLAYALFGDNGTNTFDNVDLVVTQNWSWSKDGDTNATFVRDSFSNATQADEGDLYTREKVVQLYIDGEYWGVYTIQERVNASYAAAYLGGSQDDYDVVKVNRDGWVYNSTAGTWSIEYSDEMVDGNMNAWQDLYNQMTGQFTVNYYKPTFTVGSISDAESVIGDSSLQSNAITAGASTINYINTGSDGHYTGSVAFPGTALTTDSDNFVIEVLGTINISASGLRTFGLSTSESFSFELTNGTNTYSFTHTGTGSVADVFQTFNVAAGDYNLRIVYYETTGGANLELYSAAGTYTTFNSSAFHLVGDTASGGLGFPGTSSNVAYQRVQGNNPDGTPNTHYDKLLDVQNLIDYMLTIF